MVENCQYYNQIFMVYQLLSLLHKSRHWLSYVNKFVLSGTLQSREAILSDVGSTEVQVLKQWCRGSTVGEPSQTSVSNGSVLKHQRHQARQRCSINTHTQTHNYMHAECFTNVTRLGSAVTSTHTHRHTTICTLSVSPTSPGSAAL